MAIGINDVVTVTNEEMRIFKAQAQVVEIAPDGKIGIKIGPKDKDKLLWDEERDGKIFLVEEKDVQRDTEWDIKNRVLMLFGEHEWLRIMSLKDPLNPELSCMKESCSGKREKRIMANLSGSICEIDVCASCAKKYHGSRMDDFLWRSR